MSSISNDTLPNEVSKRLDDLDRHVRSLLLVRGFSETFIIVALLIGGSLAADFLFELPSSFRLTLLVFVLAGSLYAGYRLILKPFFRKRSVEELASLVDQDNPELQERLSSVVELHQSSGQSLNHGSPYLRERLLWETKQKVEDVPFRKAVPSNVAVKKTIFGSVAFLVLLIPFTLSSSGYSVLLNRFFTPWENLGTASNLDFEITPGDAAIPRGTNLKIEMTPIWRMNEGQLSERVTLEWKNELGDHDSRLMDASLNKETWSATIPYVFRDFEYRITCSQGTSRWFSIQVFEPPAITGIRIEYLPPPYTGLPSQIFEGIQSPLIVFERSDLKFELQFNKPIEAADFVWTPEPSSPSKPVTQVSQEESKTPELVLSEDKLSAVINWKPIRDGSFQFVITDEGGLQNKEETVHDLRVIIDEKPILRVEGDDKEIRVRPDDVLSIDVSAEDDIGVAELDLHVSTVNKGELLTKLFPQNELLGKASIDTTFDLNLASLDLGPGETITYRVRATDARPIPAPHEIWSTPRILIIDPNSKSLEQQQLEKEQRELQKSLEDILKQASDNRKNIRKVHNEVRDAQRKKKEYDEPEKIVEIAKEQNDISKQLEEIAQKLAERPLYKEPSEKLADIARNEIAEAQKLSEQSLEFTKEKSNQSNSKATDALRLSEREIQKAEKQIKQSREQMKKLAALEKDLLKLNELAKDAEELSTDAAELEEKVENNSSEQNKNDTEKSDDNSDSENSEIKNKKSEDQENSNASKKELDKEQDELKKRSQNLSKELDKLLERRPEIIKAAEEFQKQRLQNLADKTRELEKQENELADALNKQKKLPNTPKDKNPESDNQSQERKKLQQEQKDLANKAEQLAKKSAQKLGEQDELTKNAESAEKSAKEAENQLKNNNLEEAEKSADQTANKAKDAATKAKQDAKNESLAKEFEDLAKKQNELKEKMNQLNQSDEKKQSDKTEISDAESAKQLQNAQKELAQKAAQLAKKSAEELGNDTPATKRALETADAAKEAEKKVDQGDFDKAKNAAKETSENAKKTAEEPDENGKENPLADEFNQLAKDQKQLEEEMKRLAKSADARAETQKQTQNDINKKAEALQKEVEDVANALKDNPLERHQLSRETDKAKESLEKASERMSDASKKVEENDPKLASRAAKQSADMLKNAAKKMEQLVKRDSKNKSPVPTEVGQKVSEAVQGLEKAKELLDKPFTENSKESQDAEKGNNSDQKNDEQLANSDSKPNESSEDSASPKDGSDNKEQSKNSKSMPKNGKPSSDNKPGENSNDSNSPSQKASESLKQVAQALSKAAGQMQTGKSKSSKSDSNSKSMADSKSSPSDSPDSDQNGNQNDTVDLSELKEQIKAMSVRNWGELPPKIRSEILQSTRKKPGEEYSELVKRYFEELARSGASK